MSPDEAQEEYEEAQAEIKKKEDEVGVLLHCHMKEFHGNVLKCTFIG